MGLCQCKEKPKASILNDSQRQSLLTLFPVGDNGAALPITKDHLDNAWKRRLTGHLKKMIINLLFEERQSIEVKDLEDFYYKMVEASTEIRVENLIKMIGGQKGVSLNKLRIFVMNLIESYTMILRKTSSEACDTWVSEDDVYWRDMECLANYCLKDLVVTVSDGIVAKTELEKWIVVCSFIRDLYESVMMNIFNINPDFGEMLRPLLPKADKFTTLLRIPQVLIFSHMTRFQTKSVWRLLYDSWTDPQSWSYLKLKIVNQGPTIVLIEEEGGYLFGGFASQSWKILNGFFGDGNCFLFRLRPDMRFCTSSGTNNHYQYLFDGAGMYTKGLAFGGHENHFGIYLSPKFGPGSVSKTCTTFNDYVPLARQINFSFERVEVWAIANPGDGRRSFSERKSISDLFHAAIGSHDALHKGIRGSRNNNKHDRKIYKET